MINKKLFLLAIIFLSIVILLVLLFLNLKSSKICDPILKNIEKEINLELCNEISKIIVICTSSKATTAECLLERSNLLEQNLSEYGYRIRPGLGESMCPSSPLEISIYKETWGLYVGDIGAYKVKICNSNKSLIVAHRVLNKSKINNDTFYLFAGDNMPNQYELIPARDVGGKVMWTYYLSPCGQPIHICDINKASTIYCLYNDLCSLNEVKQFVNSTVNMVCRGAYNFSVVNCFHQNT